jgi:hypothetical protein
VTRRSREHLAGDRPGRPRQARVTATTPTTTGSTARPDRPTSRGPPGTTSSGFPNGSFQVNGSTETTASGVATANNDYSGGNGHNDSHLRKREQRHLPGKWRRRRPSGRRNEPNHLGGGNDTVSVGNGNGNHVTVGNGNDDLTFGNGSSNQIALGSGTDVVTIQGSQDSISGTGNDTVYLGGGTGKYLHWRDPSHQRLSPTHPPLLLARNPGRLLPRHADELHGGEPMSSRTTRQRGRFGRRVGMFLVLLWAAPSHSPWETPRGPTSSLAGTGGGSAKVATLNPPRTSWPHSPTPPEDRRRLVERPSRARAGSFWTATT